MKKPINLLCMSALICAFAVANVACGEPAPPRIIELDPLADCFLVIKKKPGDQTILFAKSGLSFEEQVAVGEGFASEYGRDNISSDCIIPIEEFYLDLADYNMVVDPEAIPNCYEITTTVEFPESSVPSVKGLTSVFQAAKIDGRTAICKSYGWAFTEEYLDILKLVPANSYNALKQFNNPSSDKEIARAYSGTIVGTPVIKKLGPELHDETIIF